MKQFLESLVKSIVEDPDSVVIEETQDDQGRQLLTISVNPEDMGRVIGKSGKVINSIRTILRVVAIRQGVRVRVDILDEDEKNTPPKETDHSQEEDMSSSSPDEEADSESEHPKEDDGSEANDTDDAPSASDLVKPPQE